MEDKQIIELYFKRSEQAIGATAEKYGRYCRTIAYNILRNSEDAEECESDTYMAAWNSIPPAKPQILSAFLGTITRNFALDRYAYYKAAKRNREMSVLLSELEECLPAKNTTEDAFAAGKLAEMIGDFLKTLKQEARIVFVRRYWYADSVRAIATGCHISEGKVKSILFRTRKKLAAYLEERGVCI